MKRNTLGSAWGSILAMQAGVQAQEAAAKPRVVKTEAQRRQDEFNQIRKEHEAEFITVEVASTDYERAQTGQATKLVEMSRAVYEKQYGISDLRKLWSLSVNDIQVQADNPLQRLKMVDSTARWPRIATPVELTEGNTEKAMQQAAAFLDSKNLQGEDRDKVILFTAYACDSNSQIDILNPEIWRIGFKRLVELGVIQSESTSTQAQPKVEQSADELRAEAEASYMEQEAGPLWSSLMDFFVREFNAYLNDKQKRALIDYVVSHNLQVLDYESWNIARRALVFSSVLPETCLSADDRLCVELDRLDTSTPAGRAEYARRKNRLEFQG